MESKHEKLAADDSGVYSKSSRGTTTIVGWTRFLGVLLLMSILFVQVYEHVRLNKLEQRQCASVARADQDIDDDDKVRLHPLSESSAETPPWTRDDR